ncbi:MAG: anti-sigma factor family protein [Oscillospiraceae bacterium]
MRSCEETLELISAALDGALTADEQTALDEHLSRCPACSALFDELKSLREVSAELEDVPAPAGFAGRVMDAIAADPAQEQSDNVVPFPVKKRSRTPWKGWAATAAVVAVVVLGAVALPGQLGMGSKSLTGASADCAAPVEDRAAEKPESFSTTSANDNGGGRSGGAAEPESAPADQPAEAMENNVQVDGDSTPDQSVSMQTASLPSSSDSPAVFCGVLTLTGELLPEELESYEYTEGEDGARIYEVPADFFFACLKTLETEQPGGFSYEAGQEDAGYGLIVVREGDAR